MLIPMKDYNKDNINYASKALDLHFCINRFIHHNYENDNDMYVLHLNSLEKDRNIFIKNMEASLEIG